MTDKHQEVIKRIEAEIAKMDKKENTVYFFVIDTKGTPSGSLQYVYNLAKITKDLGYDTRMLYQASDENDEDKFVGVADWLGEEYASLPHENILDENVAVSPSDIVFIPEIFANIMMQTKKLPCKRIAIMQNYDFILEQTPISAQWGNFGIMDALANTEVNARLLNEIFPYVKTSVVHPYLHKYFGETSEPKKLIINIVCRDQSDINKIIKPFYWKYPMMKWVSFRDLRGFPQEEYAKLLREGIATVWADDVTSFGYSALEAMKSGNVVIAKTTNLTQKWMETEDEEKLNDSCIWFDTFHEVHRIIASVVRSWITDTVPEKYFEETKRPLGMYSYEQSKKEMEDYLNAVLKERIDEMNELIKQVKEQADGEDK